MAGGLALPPAPNPDKAPEEMSMDEFQDMLTNPLLGDPDDFGFGFDAGQELGNMTATNVITPMQMPRPQMPPMIAVPPTPTSSVLPTPPPMPPNMQPNMVMGPSWNPLVGWYYPVMPQNSVPMASIPPMPQIPYAQEGFTPAPTVGAHASAGPVRSSIPTNARLPRAVEKSKRDRKRKYGPAAYLEERARQSTFTPRALSSSDVEYTSKAKQRADREYAKQNPTKLIGASRKRNQPTIVQACVCTDKKANKVKRPKNAFILYRSANADRIMRDSNEKNFQTVSKIAAQMWREESQAVKDRFFQMQADEAARHKEMYPDYHYEPGLEHKHRFGSKSCVCGAYQANMKANAAYEDDDDADVIETTAEDPYAIFSQPTGFTPAPAPLSSFPVSAGFGFQPNHQAQTGFNCNTKRHRDDTADATAEAPISKRLRSSRSPPNVSYVEREEIDIFHDGVEEQAPRPRRRPSPIATGSQSRVEALETTPPPATFSIDDSPSQNTRSKSQASATLEQQVQSSAAIDYNSYIDFNADGDSGIDWNLFNGDINWDDNGAMLSRKSSSENSRRSGRSPKSRGEKGLSPSNNYSLRSKKSS